MNISATTDQIIFKFQTKGQGDQIKIKNAWNLDDLKLKTTSKY